MKTLYFYLLTVLTAFQSPLSLAVSTGAPGAAILGYDQGCSWKSKTCDWMRLVPDSTPLVRLNLPGTHDSATWNYSRETQEALEHITGPLPDSNYFRCQEHSLFQMLNRGIRVFDLRFAWNPDNKTVGFYHNRAMLSPTTSIEQVFAGFYSWLDRHPSEALIVSLNHEGGTGTPYDARIQQHIYDLFNSSLAKKYWVQTRNSLGTLGEARKTITLIQRFEYSLLPDIPVPNPIGIYLPPSKWGDNGLNVAIVYNTTNNATAFIEDYYEIGLPIGTSTELNVQWKYNATVAHLERATSNLDHLYITFASSEHNDDEPPKFPKIMALGDQSSRNVGVNHKLVPWLQTRKGWRFGIIMLDFFDSAPGLIEAILGV